MVVSFGSGKIVENCKRIGLSKQAKSRSSSSRNLILVRESVLMQSTKNSVTIVFCLLDLETRHSLQLMILVNVTIHAVYTTYYMQPGFLNRGISTFLVKRKSQTSHKKNKVVFTPSRSIFNFF